MSNLPSQSGLAAAHAGHDDDELAALHFGAYYDLLAGPPEARPIPRRVAAPVARKSTGLIGSTLCPPGRFYH